MSGNTVYCAAIGAYGGEVYTKLYVLEIGEDEPVCEYTLHGSACIALRHISSDKFSVLCDDALYICKAKKDETVSKKVTFDSKILFYAVDSQNNTAIVFDDKETFSKDLLSVYDSDGDISYSVSVDEIKIGDNDTLSAHVANLWNADVLVILSDIDGVFDRDPKTVKEANLIQEVTDIDALLGQISIGETSSFGTGGIACKIEAARLVNNYGNSMILL
ncbi:MAG: hypothetical protein IKB94_09020, partial [Clostridia bacterium]|nr:hypothetical protein [Clostridia bacterium]